LYVHLYILYLYKDKIIKSVFL